MVVHVNLSSSKYCRPRLGGAGMDLTAFALPPVITPSKASFAVDSVVVPIDLFVAASHVMLAGLTSRGPHALFVLRLGQLRMYLETWITP